MPSPHDPIFLPRPRFIGPERGKCGSSPADAVPPTGNTYARLCRFVMQLLATSLRGARCLGSLFCAGHSFGGQHSLPYLLGDVLVVAEELLVVFAALPEPHLTIVVPGAALFHDVGDNRQIDQV